MGLITLVTGGRRSGKSAFAQSLAEKSNGSKTYIATCPVFDQEMETRVERHKKEREGKGWATVEENLDLRGAIERAKQSETILVECVTLWINNLMYEAEKRGESLTEDDAQIGIDETLNVCESVSSNITFVTNETGGGIIPDNAAARNFSDIAGRVNQAIASRANEVYLVVSGIPMKLK